jgi:hypothetical protein
MTPGGLGACPGPGMLGALGRPLGRRRRGCRRPPRTWRTARSRRPASRRPPRAGPVRSPPRTAAAASTVYWSLAFCRPRKAHSGRNRSRSPSRGSGSARLAPHHSGASAARRRNTSPGNVSFLGCGGASPLSASKMSASRASPSTRARRAVMRPLSRPLPTRRMTRTVNRGRPVRPPARHRDHLPW